VAGTTKSWTQPFHRLYIIQYKIQEFEATQATLPWVGQTFYWDWLFHYCFQYFFMTIIWFQGAGLATAQVQATLPMFGDIPIPLWIKTLFFLNKHNMMISLSLMLVSIPTLAVIFCLVLLIDASFLQHRRLRRCLRSGGSILLPMSIGRSAPWFATCWWEKKGPGKGKKSQERPKCIGKQFQDIQDDF